MASWVQDVLRDVVESPETAPRLRDAAREQAGELAALGIDDARGALVFLIGKCAGLEDRLGDEGGNDVGDR